MKATIQGVHPVLGSRDVLASIQFYRDLGFAVLFQDTPDAPRYAAVGRDNLELHIQWADPTQWTYPADRPVTPPDLAATIFHMLGIDPAGEFIDPLGRPRRITDNGNALRELVGA